jgi:hypothetical protein
MPATGPAEWLSAFPEHEREAAREIYSRMKVVEIVPANQAHVEAMVGHLREGEIAELTAVGLSDRQALELGLAHSLEAWTAVSAGVAMGIFGITADSVLADEGHPWLLTTCWTVPHWIIFARHLREAVDRYKRMFPRLSGLTDARYRPAVRLVTWLGFTIGEGEKIVPFTWERGAES